MNTPNIIEEHNIEVLGRSGLTWFWGNLEVGKKYFITYDQLEGMSMMWFLSQNKINKHAEKLDADINIWEDKVRGVWFIQLCKIDRSKSIKLTQMSTPKISIGANRLLTPVYMSTHTTCKCGKNAELKWNGNWYGNKCECGSNIRMHRDKSRIIID